MKSDPVRRADVSPPAAAVIKIPMESSDLWGKIYAIRNDQLVLLYSLDEEGIKKLRTVPNRERFNKDLDKNLRYSISSFSDSEIRIKSWGDFVVYAVRAKIDLSGLTFSPEQKKCLYEYELQKRGLTGAKLDHAVLDGMDFSGTDFSEASLQHASLKGTAGEEPNFSNVKGYLLDLSGSSYTSPNFSSMTAARSTHFRSTYEMPRFVNTNWNSAHMVGTRIFLKDTTTEGLDVSSGLMAACLFYGMDTEPVAAGLAFSHAAFPGSCFYNLRIDAGGTADKKADFSPLLLDDPRLRDEEKAYVAHVGQWLNSAQGMDGVKVSPEVKIDLDPQKIYTMFSEVKFDDNYRRNAQEVPLFFSKGNILNRTSFNECEATDIDEILPESLAKRLRATDAPVVVAVTAEQGKTPAAQAVENSIEIPEVTIDRDQISLQVEALKKASVGDATAIGSTLQGMVTEASKLVSEWSMDHLDRRPLKETLDAMIATISQYSLAVPVPKPELPDPEPVAPEPGFFVKVGRFLAGTDEEPVYRAPPSRPVPRDAFTDVERVIGEFPKNIASAINENAHILSDSEKMHKFLETLKSAFDAYIDDLGKEMIEIKTKNPGVAMFVDVRKANLEVSRDLVARLASGVGDIVAAMGKDSLAYQWLQSSTLPQLTTEFTKAAGLHGIIVALRKGKELPRGQLAGLYNLVVSADDPAPPQEQITKIFTATQKSMLTKLHDVQTSLEKSHKERTTVLKDLLELS